MKKSISDIAYDHTALRKLLQTLIEDLQRRNIQEDNVNKQYYNQPKLEFKYDDEWRKCKMGIRLVNWEIYQLFLNVEDSHWNRKECLIAESKNLSSVIKQLYDSSLVDKLYAKI